MVAFESVEVIFLSCDEPLNAIIMNGLLVFQRAEEFMIQWLNELLHSPLSSLKLDKNECQKTRNIVEGCVNYGIEITDWAKISLLRIYVERREKSD
jgi:hypothetical protein